MINIEKDNVITLDDNSKYYIKEDIVLDGIKYLICIMVDELDNITNTYKIFYVKDDNLIELSDKKIIDDISKCLTLL